MGSRQQRSSTLRSRMRLHLNSRKEATSFEVTSDAVLSAPEILPYEIGNALSAMIKRGQISKAEALEAILWSSKIHRYPTKYGK